MKFCVLGPVEVQAEGVAVPIGGPMQRTLLAVLLLQANRLVPVERLIDELWPEGAPASARNLVQGYVSGLRRALRARGDGPDPLVTRPAGYELRVEPGTLDVQRFEELVDEAHRARDAGLVQRAVDRLQAALDVWRGEALAGVSQGTLTGDTMRLEEARLLAFEERVDMELELGRNSRLIGELAAIRSRHPLRERPVAQLMLALYDAGRRGDALNVYQEARRTLAEELGLDPGPELQRLQASILKNDPSLVRRGFRPLVPMELPRSLDDFTGREAELAGLADVLGLEGREVAGRGRPVVISGMGGIGKSALAIRAAHQLVAAGSYPDGQLYVNLQGATAGMPPLAPIEALGRMLRSLGVDAAVIPVGVEEAAARFRSTIAGRRLLLLLDGASSVEQVVRLLPGTARCGVLITSRQVLATLEGAWTMRLGALPEAQSLELLGRIVGPHRIAGERGAAVDLVHHCGRLPLAIRVAGSRLLARPQWSVGELAERLTDAADRLEELEVDSLGVRASFDVSLDALRDSPDPVEAAAASAFELLGLPEGQDLGGEAAARLLDRPAGDARLLLERLVDAQLLESSRPGRYQLHDLLRLYARERCQERRPHADRLEAVERLLAFYTATARGTLAVIRPGDRRLAAADPRWRSGGLEFELEDHPAALVWFETERSNLLAAVAQAAVVAPRLCGELVRALFACFYARGYWHDMLEANETALRVARRLGDRAAEAIAITDLGPPYLWLGPPAKAIDCGRESLAIYEEIGDRLGQAASLGNLGATYTRLGRHDEAIQCLRRSLSLFQEVDDRRGLASSLGNLAVAQGRVGRLDAAICHQRESIDLFKRLDAHVGISAGLSNLGVLYSRQGRHGEAIACHEESLTTYRRVGAHLGQVIALRDLGDALQAGGREEEARPAWQESLTIGRSRHVSSPDETRLRVGRETYWI